MAVIVCEPALRNCTSQLPVPPERVNEQFESAPVMFTDPVGVVEPPVTVTVTVTYSPSKDGSGVSVVMLVVVLANATAWLSVPVLPSKVGEPESGVYVAVKVLFPKVVKVKLQFPFPPDAEVRVMVGHTSPSGLAVISKLPVGVVSAITATFTTTFQIKNRNTVMAPKHVNCFDIFLY